VQDEEGFISFKDRLGDTYRAKGHNISTTEVETWLSRHPSVASVNVYAIPMNQYGYDGQLGCAAITLHNDSSAQFDQRYQTIMSQLEQWLRESESALPAYAIPRFVRILINNETSALDSGGMRGDSGSERVSVIMKKLKTGLRKDGELFCSRKGQTSRLERLLNFASGFVLPAGSPDRMFWIEREGTGYTPLTPMAIQRLVAGKAQL
jgi:acyl-CoA synthetase (AMP-forming)/AMP-acid ligase II